MIMEKPWHVQGLPTSTSSSNLAMLGAGHVAEESHLLRLRSLTEAIG